MQYTWDYSAGDFDTEGGTDKDNCFIGTVSDDAPGHCACSTRYLGGRVRVRIRQLTPKRGAGAKLGTVIQRHAQMLTMRVKPDDLHLLFNQVASPGALKALRTIGCSAKVLI